MNDLIGNREDFWNERLKECIAKAGYSSQVSFAKAFNAKYKTKCTQKDISRWINVGKRKDETNSKTKEKMQSQIGFPSYQNMLRIADFFDISVSYLTGETNYDTFSYEKASSFIGLSQNCIKELRKIANFQVPHSVAWHLRSEPGVILNKLITSDGFLSFIESLDDLDYVYSGPNKEKVLWEDLYKKYDSALINEAIDHMDDHFENGDPEPSPELCEAIKDVRSAFDKGYDISMQKEYDTDVFKYRLQMSFNRLLETLYPNK